MGIDRSMKSRHIPPSFHFLYYSNPNGYHRHRCEHGSQLADLRGVHTSSKLTITVNSSVDWESGLYTTFVNALRGIVEVKLRVVEEDEWLRCFCDEMDDCEAQWTALVPLLLNVAAHDVIFIHVTSLLFPLLAPRPMTRR